MSHSIRRSQQCLGPGMQAWSIACGRGGRGDGDEEEKAAEEELHLFKSRGPHLAGWEQDDCVRMLAFWFQMHQCQIPQPVKWFQARVRRAPWFNQAARYLLLVGAIASWCGFGFLWRVHTGAMQVYHEVAWQTAGQSVQMLLSHGCYFLVFGYLSK